MAWCTKLSELKDFMAFVVLYGPDEFPAWREMDMTKAFLQIYEGLDECRGEFPSGAIFEKVKGLLLEAEAAYKAVDIVKGAHRLQDAMAQMKA